MNVPRKYFGFRARQSPKLRRQLGAQRWSRDRIWDIPMFRRGYPQKFSGIRLWDRPQDVELPRGYPRADHKMLGLTTCVGEGSQRNLKISIETFEIQSQNRFEIKFEIFEIPSRELLYILGSLFLCPNCNPELDAIEHQATCLVFARRDELGCRMSHHNPAPTMPPRATVPRLEDPCSQPPLWAAYSDGLKTFPFVGAEYRS